MDQSSPDPKGNYSEINGSTSYGRRRGRCKWFNVAKGWGFITPEDGGQDVFVHQSVIQMPGFRSLGDEEEVEFECKESDKGLEATFVTGPEGTKPKGSHRRPLSKKKFRKFRCYNCGEFANHLAAKCNLDPQPKRCHHCKSGDHLIANCPLRTNSSGSGVGGANGGSGASGGNDDGGDGGGVASGVCGGGASDSGVSGGDGTSDCGASENGNVSPSTHPT